MRKSVAFVFIFIGALALALSISRARANPGDLDPTWGDGGIARVAVSENGDMLTTGQLDPDGKVVAVGWVDGYPGAFGVARLRADGSPDPSFGMDGQVMTRFSADPDLPNSAWSISSRPGGGYLVAGEVCDVDYVVCEWLSAAYRADGTLDLTFGGGDGWITTTVAGADGVYAWPPRNVTQSDGKVIVGGIVVQPDGDIDLAVRRHNLDGSLDAGYGDGGIAVYDFGDAGNYVENMTLLPDGKLLLTGGFGEVIDPFTYTAEGAFLMRLESDGSIDTTFGNDGKTIWSGSDREAISEGLAVSPAGDIFVAGGLSDPDGVDIDCAVWRFDAAGDMDMGFGDGGQLVIDTGLNDPCLSIDLLPDGRLALSGSVVPAAAERMSGRAYSRGAAGRSAAAGETLDALVARAHPGGTLDTTFGDGGILVHDIGESDNGGFIALAQPDGRMLVLGDVPAAGMEMLEFAISRFQGDALTTVGQLDPTWGDEGISFAVFDGADESGFTQLLQPDGKVIVAGWADIWPGDFGAARFLPDGRLDTDFGEGGRVLTAFSDDPELVDAAYGISGRPNGGFHLFGETCDADYIICQLAVAAYLADGSLDTSFGGDGKVVTDPGGVSSLSWPNRNILQPDGKLVAGGVVYQESGDVDIVLVRYNPDGSLDESFGDGGMAIQDFQAAQNYPQDILLLPDGKILVSGGFSEIADDDINYVPSDAYLARFMSNGDLDLSFGGGDGYVNWNYDGVLGLAQRTFLHPGGGYIVLGASFTEADPGDCTLQLFDTDGNRDMSYGDGGWVTIDSGHDDFCWDMELTADGKVVFAGWATQPEDPAAREAAGNSRAGRGMMRGPAPVTDRIASEDASFNNLIGRYYLDGTPDETFGDGGLVGFRVNEARAYIHGLSVQPDGKYVVSGDALSGEFYDFVALRFLGDGPAAKVFAPVVQR